MTERDAFEVRLRTAVQGYVERVSSDLEPAEFAHRIAVREPRRHGFAAALRWGSVAIPKVAWVLLLLAALLSATVAGLLVAGSLPQRKLPSVVPPVYPAFVCPAGTNPDSPGPVDQARPPWVSEVTFDRRAGALVALAGIEASPDAVETWTFDVCSNTWTRMQPNREPLGDGGSLVYDVDSDVTIGAFSGTVWTYNLQKNVWAVSGVAAGDPGFHDPVTGLVVATGAGGELLNYHVETDTWTPIRQTTPRGSVDSQFVYDTSVDRIVDFAGGDGEPETWLFDLRTGAWSRSGAETPSPVFRMGMWALPAIVYDEAAERTVVAGDFRWGAYDATADRWEILVDVEARPKPMVYDPANRRLIVAGGGIGIRGDLVAFDLVTREWTVLLEARE